MTIEARIRLRHRGCISEALTGVAHAARVSPKGEADVLMVQGADDAQLARLHHAIAAARPHSEVVSRAPGSLVLRLRGAPHLVATDVHGAGCAIVWPVVYRNGEEHYTLLAPSRERLDALLERLARHGDLAVERLGVPEGTFAATPAPLAELTSNLTERQLSVLLRAIEDGYYDSPRRTSAEALAAAHGVTRTTLEEHLRKAERRVLEGFASAMRAQPALAQSVGRKTGRPPRAPQPPAPLSESQG